MDEKLIATVNKIKLLAEQNPEFNQNYAETVRKYGFCINRKYKFYYYRRYISKLDLLWK